MMIARADGKNLLWKKIETEKAEDYESMVSDLLNAGMKISAFVIDGRRGVLQRLLKKFPLIPVQLCQFHQVAIVKRYLSSYPKLEAGKELRRIALTLAETDRKTFTEQLVLWHTQWTFFLKEKSINPVTGRSGYTHRRLRSAYRSLTTNLPWLFTFQDHPGLKIPNTTNSCDGSFAHWKAKLSVHRGLKWDRKRKMMNYLLENS